MSTSSIAKPRTSHSRAAALANEKRRGVRMNSRVPVSIEWEEAQGQRVGFEGVSIIKLLDGLIVEYREVANVGPALVALGFAPERVCKILAREGKRLRGAPEMGRHLG